MRLTFVSHSIIDFRMDTMSGDAFGKILIYYRRDDAPSILEHEQVHISCPFCDKEPEWRMGNNIIKLSKNKLLQLEIAFPRVIENIFKDTGSHLDDILVLQEPITQSVQSTHVVETQYIH